MRKNSPKIQSSSTSDRDRPVTHGGRSAPWQHGLWRAIGKAYIRKEHAELHKDNWEAKLANPARVAYAPSGATEGQKNAWFRRVMAWGINSVFGLTPGYEVKLLESNGRGYESFEKTVANQNDEFKMALAGQLVTSDGGAGFQNSDIHRAIRADLIQADGDELAYTINTQVLPYWQYKMQGDAAFENLVSVHWDTTPPADLSKNAATMVQLATAIAELTKSLGEHGLVPDVRALATQFGIPLADEKGNAATATALADVLQLARVHGLRPDEASVRAIAARLGVMLEEQPEGEETVEALPLAPTDAAKVIKGKEARASLKLGPFNDERDELTITQLGETSKADAEADAEIEVDEHTDEKAAACGSPHSHPPACSRSSRKRSATSSPQPSNRPTGFATTLRSSRFKAR